jgi:hypothetical protein
MPTALKPIQAHSPIHPIIDAVAVRKMNVRKSLSFIAARRAVGGTIAQHLLVPLFGLSNLFAKTFQFRDLLSQVAAGVQERPLPVTANAGILPARIHPPASAFLAALIRRTDQFK